MRSHALRAAFALSFLTVSAFGATDITISTGATANGTFAGGVFTLTADPATANVNNGDIQNLLNAGTTVIIDTTSAALNPGNIDVTASVLKSGGGNAGLTLRATNKITITTVTISSTSNQLAITLNADRDGNDDGPIVGTDSTLDSNNGALTLGGGANPLANPAAGDGTNFVGIDFTNVDLISGSGATSLRGVGHADAASTQRAGIRLQGGSSIATSSGSATLHGQGLLSSSQSYGIFANTSTITTATGAIDLTGLGGPSSTGSNAGILLRNAGISSTGAGAGSITLTGTGGGINGAQNSGVEASMSSSITTATGDLSITGTAGDGDISRGVFFLNGSALNSTGTGADAASITVNGTGGGGSGATKSGILFSAGSITSIDGNIQLTGTGGTGGGGNEGVRWNFSTISSTGSTPGAALITISGTGGTGTNNGRGVTIDGNSLVTSVVGAISISNTAAASSGQFNYGVNVFASTVRSTGTGASAAPITITGAAGPGTNSNMGVGVFTNAVVTSVDGPIQITGQGGAGSGSDNHGISVAGTVSSTGVGATAATITLNGTGGDGSAAETGVSLFGTVTSVEGNIQITGQAGGGASGGNHGITVVSPGVVSSTGTGAGAATISMTGTGGPTGFGYGVYVVDGTVTSIDGAVLLTGFGGNAANTNHGIFVQTGQVTGTGIAPVQLIGTGAGSGTGVISSTGTINVAGAVSMSGSSIDIQTTSVAHFGTLNFNSPGNVSIFEDSSTILLGSSTGNPVMLASAGSITDGGAAFITVGTAMTLNAASGGIGTLALPIRFDAGSLTSTSGANGNQFLQETNSVNITSLDAGTGTITLVGGTFALSASNGINDATSVAVATGTLAIGTFNETVAGLILNGGNANGSSGVLTVASTIDARSGSASAILGGASGLTKTTAGTVTLTGANTYTGATTITAGTLLVNGSLAAGSPVTVNGGTLGGTGTINGTVQVNAGGTIAPGVGPGILSTGSVTLAGSSTASFEVNGPTAGAQYDQINVTGTVNINNATLVTTGTIAASPATEIVLINNDGADAVTGNFAGLPNGSSVVINGVQFYIFYNRNGGNDVVLRPASLISSGIDIVKRTNGTDNDTAPGPLVPTGSVVTFQYTVTNSGTETLQNVVVTDDNGTPGTPGDDITATLTGGDTNSNNLLETTETWTFTATRNATAGQYTNIGRVTATDSVTAAAVSDSNVDNHFGSAPGIDIVKRTNGTDNDTAPGVFVLPGSIVTFTYTVTNTGNVPLGTITVSDDNGTPGNLGDDFAPAPTGGDTNSNSMLDLGETWTYSATRIATLGQYTNIGTVTGTPVVGTAVSDSNPDNHVGSNSAINIVLLTNGTDNPVPVGVVVPVGSTVTFTYTVTNPGNTPLSAVTVTDNNGTPANSGDDFSPTFSGGDTNSNSVLEVTETWTYTATRIVTFGPFTNVATATGTPPPGGGPNVSDTDVDNHFGGTAAQIPALDPRVLLMLAAVLGVGAFMRLRS